MEKSRPYESSKVFTDLLVWQKSHAFVLLVYKLNARFPKEELFGRSAQMRRAVISIPANIAEGFKKKGKQDKLRFYNIAQDSLEECRYYLLLTQDLKYSETSIEMSLLEETSKLFHTYAQSIITKSTFLLTAVY
jgi:four helix bundle protein